MAANTIAATAIVSSVSSVQVGEHEITCWSDGSVTIEHWMYQFTQDPTLDHVVLSAEQARELGAFLQG